MAGMMPPGGGGGADLAAQLMQLAQSPQAQAIMQSPKGQQMAQAIMAQMGGGGGQNPMMGGQAPQMAQQPMGGNMTDGDISEAEGMLDQVSGGVRNAQQGPQTNYATGDQGPMPDPRQTPMPSTEDELAMVQSKMGGGGGGGGGGGMNPDGPTPEEIQLLKSSPTPRNIANFEKLFGPGSAQQVLAGGGGGAAPPTGGSTYEQDVQGAMDDADEGDHEYR